MIHLQHPSSKGRANSKLRCLQVSRKIDKIKILALICFNSPWLVNGCTFFFLFSMACMVEVVKVFVFTECYELSIVRNDTPIYKAIVYIKVNVEICTHVSPWLNFSNTEIHPSDVYISVQRFAYPHIIGGSRW